MTDRRQSEEGLGRFSKSGWVRRQIKYPKPAYQKTSEPEMEQITREDPYLFVDPEEMSETFGDSNESSDHFTSSEHWSLPWSDLMMTMFVLFAVLLSVHVSESNLLESAHAKARMSKAQKPVNAPIKFPSGEVELSAEQIYRLSHQALRFSHLDQIEVIFEEDKTVRISVRGPLFFDTGHAALRNETRKFLDQLLPVLKKINNEIHVVGHTDDVPVRSSLYASNWELSSSRASNVAKYLIQTGSLEPARFSVIGRSMYRPKLPNTTKENRQRNRRVDIIITRKQYESI